MFDPAKFDELIGQLGSLNQNLQVLHGDMAELRELNQNIRRVSSYSKDLVDRLKVASQLTRQLALLNQIMMQVSKTAGASGMIENLLKSILTMASAAK